MEFCAQFADFNRPELERAILLSISPAPLSGDYPSQPKRPDVTGQAQTGTGKTAAFALPILNRIDPNQVLPQTLVVAPTHELALQVTSRFSRFPGQFLDVHVLTVYGGTSSRNS